MDPNDKELKEQLSRDPFARSGFDGRLRQRIEERIKQDNGRIRRPWKTAWRWPAVALASVAAVFLAVWLWNSHAGDGQTPEEIQFSSALASATPPSAVRAEQPVKYALLIGLRTDESNMTGVPQSRYRTVLVAQESEKDQPRLWAENPGLYMPYGQNFWQIATVRTGDGRDGLQAIQVTNRKTKTSDKTIRIPDYLLSQRVLYAGNKFLSVSSTIRVGKDGQEENRMVKRIDQINDKPADPGSEPHVILQDVVPDVNPGIGRMDQWSIVRNPGQWVPELFDPLTGEEETLPSTLPQDMARNDTLSLGWEEIQKVEPGAKDAFTYGNLLGVVAGGNIRVHAVKGGKAQQDVVNIPLSAGESVIMIQWAEGDTYVKRWIKDMQALSGSQTQP